MVRIVDRNFYMDDFIKSLNSTAMAKKIFTELVQCLKLRGFELKKWITNNAELNAFIPENLRSASTIKSFDVEAIKSSILGLKWLVEDDVLEVSRGPQKEIPDLVTQRAVLSHGSI